MAYAQRLGSTFDAGERATAGASARETLLSARARASPASGRVGSTSEDLVCEYDDNLVSHSFCGNEYAAPTHVPGARWLRRQHADQGASRGMVFKGRRKIAEN